MGEKRYVKRRIGFFSVFILLLLLIGMGQITVHAGTTSSKAKQKRYPYGVFIGANKLDYEKMGRYDVVVIDAQNRSKAEIHKLKKAGCKKVISYLNIGAIEEFRPYYSEYADLVLGSYDNWEDEHWVDVSKKRWQTHCIRLAKKIKAKGVDGFFIDNTDVYYKFPEEKIYKGCYKIVSAIKKQGNMIIINGGDEFVTKCLEKKQGYIFDAANQESIYTMINYDENSFVKANKEKKTYFTDYLDRVKKAKKTAYVLEYAKAKSLISKAKKYAKKHGWTIYVASSLNLK